MTLLQEIQAACTPQEMAARAHDAIAVKVSAGRMRLVRGAEITTRGAAAKFPALNGLPGALAFEAAMLKLEGFAATQRDSADLATKLMARAVARQLDGFQRLGLDFSEAALRAMLDQIATSGVLTQDEADGFKALALAPDPVTPAQVAAAIDGA